MLTRNFAQCLRNNATGQYNELTCANTTAGVVNPGLNYQYNYYTASALGWFLDVGFGSTSPTFNDYKLENSNSMDNAVLTHVNGQVFNTANVDIKAVQSTYKNNTENNVTVTELGIIGKNSNANSKAGCVLIARVVLNDPVTIPPGGICAFQYRIQVPTT